MTAIIVDDMKEIETINQEGERTVNAMTDVNEVQIETMDSQEASLTVNTDEHKDGTSTIPPITPEELTKGAGLPLHPYCAMFPVASQDDIATLAEDIRRNGFRRKSIVLYQDEILDGRNRYLACKIAGVEPTYIEYAGDTSDEALFQFVISENISRRHLTTSQKAMIAEKMTGERSGNPPTGGFTQAEAGKIIGVSERDVQRAAKLRREAPPELIAEVERGAKTVHVALEECKTIKSETPVENVSAMKIAKSIKPEQPEPDTPTPSTNSSDNELDKQCESVIEDKQVEEATPDPPIAVTSGQPETNLPDQANGEALQDAPEQAGSLSTEGTTDTNAEPVQPATAPSDNTVIDNATQTLSVAEPEKSDAEQRKDIFAYLDKVIEDMSVQERSKFLQKLLDRYRRIYERIRVQVREAS